MFVKVILAKILGLRRCDGVDTYKVLWTKIFFDVLLGAYTHRKTVQNQNLGYKIVVHGSKRYVYLFEKKKMI